MNRKFTMLITAFMLVMTSLAWGQTRTPIVWTASEQGYTNSQAIESVTFDDNVSAIFNKGSNSNAPKYFDTGSSIRCYGGNYFTVTSTSGNLTEIVLTFGSGDGTNAITTDVGTFANGTWTGGAASVTFTIGGTNGHRKIAAFTITYGSGSTTQTVATPTFSPAEGTYFEAQNVTISCATAGAIIYYTLDGSTPTPNSAVYSTPIVVSESTTIKAMAAMAGMNNSSIAMAEYTIQDGPTFMSIAEARSLPINEYALVQGIVTFIDGKNVYIQDESAGIDLFLNSAVSTLALGDEVQAYGKRDVFNGLVELTGIDPTNASQFSVISTGNALPLAEITIAEILADPQNGDYLQSTRVKVVNASMGAINTSGNTPITQNGSTINIYKIPALNNIQQGDYVDVIGVIGYHNASQLRVALASDVTLHESSAQTVATPTFSPVAGTYTEAQNVTISCATQGATIYYTTNGTNPIGDDGGPQGSIYSSPIAISATTTVKAVAVKQGMNNSAIATATYTIQQTSPLTTINEIWNFADSVGATATPASVTFNNWYVSGVKGGQAIITDGQYGFVIYQSNHGFVAGDKLNGTVNCNVLLYQSHYAELTGVTASSLTVTPNQEVPMLTTTIGALTTRNYGTPINLGTLTYDGSKFNDASGAQITPYNNFNLNPNPVTSLAANAQYNVKGVYIVYWQSGNPVQQVAPRSAADFEEITPSETVATPTFTPEAGDYTQEISVQIACATEGASIYYTLDGNDPMVSDEAVIGTLYGNPILISDTTTVKAIAVKQGMENSEIAMAIYNINIVPPAQETDYTLITNANALIAGDKYIIVGIKGDGYKALGKQNTANRVAVDVTAVDSVITLTPATTNEDGVFELTLGQAGDYWTLYDAVNQGYLYAASSTANQLKVQAQNDANGQWSIDIAPNGVATIKAQGENTRNWLRLNNNGTPFSCYASGQLNVYLYKAGDVPAPPAPSYYAVNVAQVTGGAISVSQDSAMENDTIYVNAVPDNGYELTSLTYSYTGASPISIMETGWFLMPASEVTVSGVFTELQTVIAPTFTPAEGSYITAQTVSLACATEGATIYYTTDGTDPTLNSAVYSAPFTVSVTTTVKAMAAMEDMNNSTVASATYTIIEPMTIAAAKALANNEYALVEGVVTFIDGRNVYVQDATAGIDLYLNTNTVPENLAVGDMVLGYGKKAIYNGLIELTGINGGNANQFVVLSNGNELPLAVKTVAEILADNTSGANLLQSTRVQVVNATIGAINTANNTPITQDGSTINIYKMPVVEGLEQGDYVTVIGVIGCYNNPQLRVNSAEDVEFAHPAGITVAPASLSGFNYVYEEGPSTAKSFVITARSLSGTTYIVAPESYELSSFPGDAFHPQDQVTINTSTGAYSYTIKVRLKAGLEIGTYDESIMIFEEELDTIYMALSGSVTGVPQPTADYVRVTDLSQIGNGAKVIFAARYNENVNEYFAMTAQASGKPEGVLFTSVAGSNAETLPAEITDAEDTYYWTVTTDGANYTFTNANGDVLGYTSSTNFATGGDNVNWTITPATSEATAMVPDYTAFNVINANVTNRAFALNSNHNYGPYHTQNMTSENYNFFVDIFATAGGTPTCAAPTFDPVGGAYFEVQTVTISCGTADATIYYTLDGSDPTPNSLVYSEPIEVAESMTIKAYAVKEGFNDSNIAEAEYTIILGAVTIFFQDWEGEMNGWTFVSVEGNKPWNISQYNGNHYAYANGYNGGVNEQWCISPAFSLEQYSDVSLSFMNAMNYTGPNLQLYFSNDYDGSDPSDATWTELTFEMSTGSYTWTESGVIELANFSGNNCYIGFKYTSTETEAAAWEVDDILLMGYTSDPVLNVTPLALTFSYIEGNGPSAEQTIAISGFNLSDNVVVTIDGEGFEMSDVSGEDFDPMEEYEIEPLNGAVDEVIYVRMAEGLDAGSYSATISITSELDDYDIDLTGTVLEPIQGGEWNRISSLADLHDGDQLVIAARYDASVGDGYYAMTAGVSGKPEGVLFTSVNENGIESLPDEMVLDIETFVWVVTVNDNVITLTNAAGDLLGYSSSTNFAGNTSTNWSIDYATSGENAMVPNYDGFLITNVETNNRCIVMNANHNFGAYHTNNINSGDYNFYLDLFVQGGSATQTVATPVFSVASGTYFEEFDVEITCATEDATIYYTTDGTEPTAASLIYEEPILVDSDVTIKAIAMLEGFENSNVATVNYTLMIGQAIILNQDWEGDMNGWTFVTVEGNKPWNIGQYNGNHYAYANGYNDDDDNEQWCISPAFDLTYYRDVVLTFRNAMKFTGPDMQLFFSSNYDGEHPTSATWTSLDFEKSEGNYVWTESGEISLDGLYGRSNCYIAFLYTSNLDDGAAAWEVDDILIVGTAYDAVEETTVMDINLWNADNEIFVDNQTNGNVEMTVFNLLGQPVMAKSLSAGSVRFSHSLATGVYVVTLQNSKGRMAVKMIIK